MRERRQARINDEMRRVLAEIIARSLKDPRIPPLTSLTEVQVSGDLSLAKCYLSLMANDEGKKEALRALRKAEGFLRTELAHKMKIRQVPNLKFFIDDSVERGLHLDRLIDEAMGRS